MKPSLLVVLIGTCIFVYNPHHSEILVFLLHFAVGSLASLILLAFLWFLFLDISALIHKAFFYFFFLLLCLCLFLLLISTLRILLFLLILLSVR